jgi:acetyl esterase/lipase
MRAPRIVFFLLLNLAFIASDAAAGRWPDGVIVSRDIAYGGDPAQKFDVYHLPAEAKPRAIILMVHGGGWAYGDKNSPGIVDNKVSRWLPRGYVFVSTNYRMLPKLDAYLQANDVARALAYVQAHAAEWGGDPDKVILMGHSAGAHLVALLSAAPERAYVLGARPWLATVSLDTAAFDMVKVMQRKHMRMYDFAFGKDPERWRKASPVHVLGANAVPLLAVCSTERIDRPCDDARVYVERAEALGLVAATLPQALDHGQINRELGLPSVYTAKVEQFMTAARSR